jgi:hypothetical protein
MKCSGSVALTEKALNLLGEPVQSSYAAHGTAMHSAAEALLTGKVKRPKNLIGLVFNEVIITAEDLDRFLPYVEYVQALMKKYKSSATLYVEVKVKLTDQVWGTADTVICLTDKNDNRRLVVIDLKTGSGVSVFAEGNLQLAIYALGAYDLFNPIYEFDYVDMVISQPPKDILSTWTVDVRELEEYRMQVYDAIEAIEKWPNAYVPSEEACRWCPGKAICPAVGLLVEKARQMDLNAMTGANIGDALLLAPIVKLWLEGVENFSKDYMLVGNKVPGFKVVRGRRGNRKWKDPDAAESFLEKYVPKFRKIGYNVKLKTPPQMISALAELEVELEIDDLITQDEGSPTIVPDSDKRDAITPGSRAAADFEGV